MMQFLNKYRFLLLTFLASFAIFYPSLFVFFTNDDFFFLNIGRAGNIREFLNFFSLAGGPEGFGMYRPLTTQAFYFMSWKFLNLSPFPLHIISFMFFFAIVYLVYRLSAEITKNEKVGLISAFLYAVSATHFGQLYYLAAFQELGMTLFVLLSCLTFVKGKNVLSFIFFVLAIMSKETAVVTPLLFVLIYFFRKYNGEKVINFKKLLIFIFPFTVCLFAYLLVRFQWYGFASGDSYIWDFSIKKFVNTSAWYLLWSLNIPESLVDFVGPGLKINSNLFVFWGKQINPILISFLIEGLLLLAMLIKLLFNRLKEKINKSDPILIFCIGWFFISLLPVIFLPLHKFSFYLTLPLIGVVLRIAYVLVNSKINRFIVGAFLIAWTTTSVLTLKFTYDTNWITQSELISQRVFVHFKSDQSKYEGKTISFIDTNDDSNIFWSPTSTVRTVLSDKNFFYVFFPNLADKIDYNGQGKIQIKSRRFLGY
jgi:hypothetical protein